VGLFVGLNDSGLIVVGLRLGVGEAVGDTVRSTDGDTVGVTVNVSSSLPKIWTSPRLRMRSIPGRMTSTSSTLIPLRMNRYVGLLVLDSSGSIFLLEYATAPSCLRMSSKPTRRLEQQSLLLKMIISETEATLRRLSFHHGFGSLNVRVVLAHKPSVLSSIAREATRS